jgi:hypothetical protein
MKEPIRIASIASQPELLLVAVGWIFYRRGMKDGEF